MTPFTRSAFWLCAALTLHVVGCAVPDSGTDGGDEDIVSVDALSRHFVEITFRSAPPDIALVPERYSITDTDGTGLVVHHAVRKPEANCVLLTTDVQEDVDYTLVFDSSGAFGHQIGPDPVTIAFRGSLISEPALVAALALDNTTVMLTFSEFVDESTSERTAAYSVSTDSGDPLAVADASVASELGTILLTTGPQDAVPYSISVSNVLSRRGDVREVPLDPTQDTAAFVGIAAEDDAPPRVTGAQATGRTSVAIALSEPLDDGPVDSVQLQFSPDLHVTKIVPSEYRTQLFLITAPQVPSQSYTVTVNAVRDRAGNLVDAEHNSASFSGTSREFFVQSAVALSNRSVLVTFNDTPDLNTALRPAFYQIGNEETGDILHVVEANADPESPRAVILSTVSQADADYRLRVTRIAASRDHFPLDPTRNTWTFHGIGTEDVFGPIALGAAPTSSNNVLIQFSEPLDPGAASAVNFAVECTGCAGSPLPVVGALAAAHNTQIILITHEQEAGVEYVVRIANVNGQMTDASSNRNELSPMPSEVSFLAPGQPAFAPPVVLPRVVGAASLGNTSVLVTFSKPMGDSALEPAHYVIVQENVNPEVGALGVLGNACEFALPQQAISCVQDDDCAEGSCLLRAPHFQREDRTSVVLTTTSQNEVTYRVTVVNVTDLAGNQLAPMEILVDPASATFPGTPPSGEEIVDSDGDGLSDADELRGRTITIVLESGDVVQIQVTSSPYNVDTDDDGLTDAEEKRLNTNPRSADTDGDQIGDYDEYNVWYTSLVHQDTDSDGLDDHLEVFFFKTSPLLEDTDGDGLVDGVETVTGNRDPRIADLPDPGVVIGQVALRLDTRFAYTDTQGESATTAKSTSSTLAQSESRELSTTDTSTTEHAVNASTEFGAEYSVTPSASFKASVGYAYTRGNTFTASSTSTTETQEQYQESLETSVTRDITQAVTRTVEGASIDVLVTVNNAGDIPFTMRNLELTALLQNPTNRGSFIPVATMLPAAVLEGGGDFEVFLGPFIPERGPFVFKNTEVFPTLVEDLMKNPRGLIFSVANFDIEDEDGRNFAFISQDVNDRTAGLIIDYGNGTVDRYRVSTHSPFDVEGRQIGITMAFVLRDVLGLVRNGPLDAITVGPNGCGETWAVGDDIQVAQPICLPVAVGDVIITAGPNGILDSIPAGDDRKSATGNTIIDGGDGCAHTRASRDDVQVVLGDCQVASPDGIMVLPGANGRFQTVPAGDDELTTVTGYGTEPFGACDGGTDILIAPGQNAVLDSTPHGDDDDSSGSILPGPNGILETEASGDDVRKGPGFVCDLDDDCPGAGRCKQVDRLTRVKAVQNVPAESRYWIILSTVDIPPGQDFDNIRLRAGQTFSLAYVQDKDADGLIAREEFLYGSSDRDVNTDGCPLGDGAPGCDPHLFDFDTVRDFEEVKQGWTVQVEGRSSYPSYPNPVRPDSDADRLFDDEEKILGTDPGKRDSDDDGIDDDDEVRGYDITRRDGVLIRHVVPYQSAYIAAGGDGVLDTAAVGDDVLSPGLSIITTGANGELDSIPENDDVVLETRSILDGGNGIPESVASGDDEQIGPSPIATTTLTVTFLDYAANGDACDDLQDGEFSFDLRIRKNIETTVGQFLQDATVKRVVSHWFDGVIVGGPDGLAETVAAGDDLQVVGAGAAVAPDGIVVHPGPDGILDSTPLGDDLLVGPGDGGNRFAVNLEPGDAISISGTVIERDDVCDVDTRRAVIESGLVIVEPLVGGNGQADSEVPENPAGLPLYDDVQEVALGDPALPGQVVISAGPNGILETAAQGDDGIPFGNGFADTLAPAGDDQIVALAGPTLAGDTVVTCGADGEPAMALAPAVPGICEAVISRTATGDGTADSIAAGDDIQVVNPGDPVVAGDVVVRAGPNGTIDTVPAGADEDVVAARPPYFCAAVIAQTSGAVGVAQTSADPTSDDVQVIAVGAVALAGEIIIGPGSNGVIDSNLAAQVIVEPAAAGDGIADAVVAGGSDDIQVVPVGNAVAPGELIIAPGPDGVLDSATAGDDVMAASDDELIASDVPAAEDCSVCPLGDCIVDCGMCPTDVCAGDDAL
ncbi:MAG: hypothetical protein PVI86_09165, partial [Phycisphaerae bacterium]